MTPDATNTSCIILAGGRGKRLDNRDKGLVEFRHKPMIEHVIDRIQPQVDDIVISVNRNIETYRNYSPIVIEDGTTDYSGPLSGIASALPACHHDYALVVACDMPLLPMDLLVQLAAGMNQHNISIARVEQHLQLVLLIHRSLLDSLQQTLAEQKHKLMQWVTSHNPAIIDFTDTRAFSNINSHEDLINSV